MRISQKMKITTKAGGRGEDIFRKTLSTGNLLSINIIEVSVFYKLSPILIQHVISQALNLIRPAQI